MLNWQLKLFVNKGCGISTTHATFTLEKNSLMSNSATRFTTFGGDDKNLYILNLGSNLIKCPTHTGDFDKNSQSQSIAKIQNLANPSKPRMKSQFHDDTE